MGEEMKKLLNILAAAILLVGFASCSNDKSYEDDTPVPISNFSLRGENNGQWMLTLIDGKPLEEGLYQYIIFNTADMEFEIIQNLNSQIPASLTGVYTLEYDENDGNVLAGDYDHASGPWANDYVITSISLTSMTWTVLGDKDSYYVYETCPEIPEDRIPEIKSM